MHFISLKYGTIPGTNNRAKLLTMWLFLKIVADKEIRKLQVPRDSNILNDWENNKCQISNLALGPII
jgi:hypothetical protein